jgi:hypothetical protein
MASDTGLRAGVKQDVLHLAPPFGSPLADQPGSEKSHPAGLVPNPLLSQVTSIVGNLCWLLLLALRC